MANPIKYSTGSETLALKKGNFYIGTGDVGKGPSDTTGYYQAVSPPNGGYVIYLNNPSATSNISYHIANNDSELISFTNGLAGQSYTTANECLLYYAGQTDKVCLNRDYEGIVTDGLVLNLDAGFTPSYPKNGTTWNDISLSGNNGTLTNGPTFSGGSIVFDGVDDYVSCSDIPFRFGNTFTLDGFVYFDGNDMNGTIIGKRQNVSFGYAQYTIYISSGNPYTGGVGSVAAFFGRADGGSRADTVLNYNLPSEGIYNIVATVNANYQALYVNGVEVDNNLRNYTSNTFNISGRDLLIGATRGESETEIFGPFTNNIFSVKIYNRALTDSEILQNYNAQKGRFGL